MAGAQVQLFEASADPSTTTLTRSVTVTAGNWLHIVAWGEDRTIVMSDDSAGGLNVYTEVGTVIEAGIPTRLRHFVCPIVTGGTFNLTATYGTAAAFRQFAGKELSGIASYDVQATQTDTGSNPTGTCSVSNTAQPAFVSMFGIDYQSSTLAVGTGYVDGGGIVGSGGGGSLDGRAQHKSVTTVGTQSGNFVNAGFDRQCTVMAIFLESSPPAITAQPTDQTANAAAMATFSVTATGATSYQWQDNSGGSFADISGATSSSYAATSVTYSMQGRLYRCNVTNGTGTTTSSSAALRVAFNLAGTGQTPQGLLGYGPFGAGSFGVWLRGTAAGGGSGAVLAATPAAQCTLTAALTTAIRPAAAASAQCTVTAALTTAIRPAAAASAQCTVTAALTTGIALAASAQAVTTVSAALSGGAAALASAAASQCTLTAALSTGIPLAAAAADTVTLTAALSTAISPAAAASAQCTLTAALTTGIALAASAQAVTTVSATLAGGAAALAAAVAAQSTITAALTTGITLAAAAADAVTLTAALTTSIRPAATVSAQCTVTAALTTGIALQAAAQAVTTINATLVGGAAALAAGVASQCTVSAILAGNAAVLQAAGASQCTVTAALSTSIALASQVISRAQATAALSTQIRMAAAVQGVTTLTAGFPADFSADSRERIGSTTGRVAGERLGSATEVMAPERLGPGSGRVRTGRIGSSNT